MQNNTFSGLYLRQNLIVLEEVSSTNDYLKDILANIKPLPEATAIMATHQVRGRGQRGSAWLSQSGQNLTVSFVLYPEDCTVDRAFNLNMLICLGIRKWLSSFLPDVTVKWPNDIYVKGRKIGGVLIENQLLGSSIRSSVVGVGINVNQQGFPDIIKNKATSLCIETNSKKLLSIESCCIALLSEVLSLYENTDLNNTTLLLTAYNKLLFRKDIVAPFKIGTVNYLGVIKGVDQSGKLLVFIDGAERAFDLKEIQFV